MSHHQNAGQYHHTKMVNKTLKNVVNFIYLGMTVINKTYIHKEIMTRLNPDVCYQQIQSLLSSHLLSKNIKITQIEDFENRVLGRNLHLMGSNRKSELHNLYSSRNITKVIKSRMRWTQHDTHW
jgi:hypothetical protein